MNTRDIEAFVAVVETGSLGAASGRLHLTQPGVSRRLRSLEEMLGVELVDRQSKPLKPSAAGLRLYELGRGVLDAVETLRQGAAPDAERSEEHTSELQSLMRISYAVFCLKQKNTHPT